MRTRHSAFFLLCLFCVFIWAAAGMASLLNEVPPEQTFLLLRRHIGSNDEEALRSITRGLPSSSTANASLDHFNSLSSKELTKMIKDRDSDCRGCVERSELARRAYEVQQLPTMDERVAWQLTVSDRRLMSMPSRLENMAFVSGALSNTDCNVVNATIYCNLRNL
ncbi:hypothetical protein CUR178_05953 [Leishmania enriettii]|uniref:Degradation arginine-rich protein for mis-folding n=1 Tax=Leishmania enriettii TaxID=5663 RepID=A0A836HQ32_LEIEN|nr:hypothetical protein CUR178_05953 [Leishmania enriettii]